ncbi:hypothetical protein [Parvularcula marina]|uniref:hypothetical protein n=1 Tax=Parvularcula marina TaxID=2292771 RepID=UPI0035152FFB
MLLVVNANDAANGVMRLTQAVLLVLIFIVMPLAALAALGEIWTRGNPLILFGIAAAVALFFDRLIRKRKQKVLYGLFAVTALASGIAHGLQLRHEWNDAPEVGSPRTLVWGEGYQEMARQREPYSRTINMLSPAQRELYEMLTVSENTSPHSDEREFRRIPMTNGDHITYGRYSFSPGEYLDQYAQGIKDGDEDWLAFTAVCMKQRDCSSEVSNEQTLRQIQGRFNIDLVTSFTDYFESGKSEASAVYAVSGFRAACTADPFCTDVMKRTGIKLSQLSGSSV